MNLIVGRWSVPAITKSTWSCFSCFSYPYTWSFAFSRG